jgi:hypothetical protein
MWSRDKGLQTDLARDLLLRRCHVNLRSARNTVAGSDDSESHFLPASTQKLSISGTLHLRGYMLASYRRSVNSVPGEWVTQTCSISGN